MLEQTIILHVVKTQTTIIWPTLAVKTENLFSYCDFTV
jgi:hypothetical protein